MSPARPPTGYRPVPRSDPRYSPTKRLYLDPSGAVVSRRQYDNARLQSAGWESKYDFDSRKTNRENRGYQRWLKVASNEFDVPESELAKVDSEFNRLFLKARDDDFNQDPDGSFAEFLVYLGLRRPDAEGAIGDGETGYS